MGLNGKKYGHTKGASGLINTDKYEGVKGSLVHSISNEEWKKLSPAAQALIADAPLILEAYKRLREVERNLMRLVTPYVSTAQIEKALKEMIE